jgi:NTE family protein
VGKPPRPNAHRPLRVALVLGAGGPVGSAFHAGVMAALFRAGWDPRHADLIVGTSIGAVAGALLRAGLAPADMVARITGEPLSAEGQGIVKRAGGWPDLVADLTGDRQLWGGLSTGASPALLRSLARHPRRVRPGLMLAAMTRPGRVSPAAVVEVIDRLSGGAWPERPLWICTVDADTGERVILGRPGWPGVSVGEAVAASSAVPALFGPLCAGGRRFIDGGLHSPANSDVAGLADPAPEVVVMSVPMGLGGRPGRWGKDLPGRWLNHLAAARGAAPLARAGVPVISFEPAAADLAHMHYNMFELGRRGEVARRAMESAGRRLQRDGAGALLAAAAPRAVR